MVDTAAMKISLGENTGEYYQNKAKEAVVCSLKANRWFDKIKVNDEVGEELSITFRFSYPRRFYLTNAWLIKDKKECLLAHRSILIRIVDSIKASNLNECNEIINFLKENLKIYITRLDIAFTYLMEEEESFHSYYNVYEIFSKVHNLKTLNEVKKFYSGDNKVETIYFYDSCNTSNYNKKIVMYNQAKKFNDYYANNPIMLEKIYKENPDLDRRIRMEVSKKIRRVGFTWYQFQCFDVFSEYVGPYAKFLLEKLFDKKALKQIKENKIRILKERLFIERQNHNFNYTNFILNNKYEIYDWDILRCAIMQSSSNKNSGYQGASIAKKVLKDLEEKEGIIYFGVFKKIENMRKMISKYCKGEKKNELSIKK